MLHKIDDYLVDRLFQPLADRLAPLASCYGIAAFLLTGFILLDLIFACSQQQHWITMAMGLIFYAPLTAIVYHEDSKPAHAANLIALWRGSLLGFQIRVAKTVITTLSLPLWLFVQLPDSLAGKLTNTYWWEQPVWECSWLAVYFMACRKNPPPMKRTRAPKATPASANCAKA